MAELHLAQISLLSQDLFEHVKNANNLIYRAKHELDRVHQTTIALLCAYEEHEKDREYERKNNPPFQL